MQSFMPVAAIAVVMFYLVWVYRNRTRGGAPVKAAPGMDRLWELLFADQSLSDFLSEQPGVTWPELREALEAGRRGKNDDAVAALKKALAAPNLETRVALLIWNSLREIGESPSAAEAEVVQGVVVEIPIQRDAVVLAVYRDGRARLFSWRGKALLWEPTGDEEVSSLLERVLADSQALFFMAQPGRKCTAIPEGTNRVTLLTFGGIRTFDARKSDPLALDSSVGALIKALTARETKSVQGG